MTSNVLQLVGKNKACARCKVIKSLSDFHKNPKGLYGHKSKCKKCCSETYKDPRGGSNKSRPDKLKRIYGITYEHVVHTLDSQFGKCANRACGQEISLDVPLGKGRAVIDHNHSTGKFRALLCPGCNSLLGSIETKQNLIIGLNEYLTKYRD